MKFLAQGNTTTSVASHFPINTTGSTGAYLQMLELFKRYLKTLMPRKIVTLRRILTTPPPIHKMPVLPDTSHGINDKNKEITNDKDNM